MLNRVICSKKRLSPFGQKELLHSPLTLHPASPAGAKVLIVARLEAVEDARLDLDFQLTGDIGDVCFPQDKPPMRADGLWKQTCFEAFVKPEGDEGYWEFNFSPSREWAVYRFNAYRTDMRAEVAVAPLSITINAAPNLFELSARVNSGPISQYMSAKLQVGLAAVLKHKTGDLSYWALRHPKPAPDFHHTDCFVSAVI